MDGIDGADGVDGWTDGVNGWDRMGWGGGTGRTGGWMGWMGWMGWDGWMVGPLFFFGPYLENYYIIFLNYSRSLKTCFCTFFGIFAKKNQIVLFFKKFRPDRGLIFFRLFEHIFANFSKTT